MMITNLFWGEDCELALAARQNGALMTASTSLKRGRSNAFISLGRARRGSQDGPQRRSRNKSEFGWLCRGFLVLEVLAGSLA